MKRKDLVKMLNTLGWTAKRTAGSHEVFVHPRMMRPIPLPMHGADVILDRAARLVGRELVLSTVVLVG